MAAKVTASRSTVAGGDAIIMLKGRERSGWEYDSHKSESPHPTDSATSPGYKGYLAALLANYPQKIRARFIRPEEIAALIVYLASPEAAPITGACIPIDFGSTAAY